MRSTLLNSLKKFLNDNNYDNDSIKKIIYGVEAVYINITKVVLIIFISFLLERLVETIFLLLLVAIVRRYAYGVHMPGNVSCVFFSILLFNIAPMMIVGNNLQMFFIIILSIMSSLFFAPAISKKGRKIDDKERQKLKIKSNIIVLILCLLITLNITYIDKMILSTLFIQSIIVNPVTFILFEKGGKDEK